MKKIILATAMASLTISAMAAEFKTDDQKISYVIGTQIGGSLKGNVTGPIKLDRDIVFEAISDVLDDKKSQLTAEQANEVMKVFATKAGEYAKKQNQELLSKNTKEAEKLLKENKAKDGVKVTDSGLQYRVISEGKGKKPAATDVVKVHYKGTFADGSTFDSSYERGQPAEFPLNAVIKGWTEGLQLMPVGSKYEFVIPADLAYGSQAPANIGPGRALIFEVELLAVKDAEAAKAEREAKMKAEREAKMKIAQEAAKKNADNAGKTEKPAEVAKEKADKESAPKADSADTMKKAAEAVKEKAATGTEAVKGTTEKAVDATKKATEKAVDATKKAAEKAVQ